MKNIAYIALCGALAWHSALALAQPPQAPVQPPLATGAREVLPPANPQQSPAVIPAKLQIVLSRYQGEKRIATQPYTMLVTVDGRPTNLAIGAEVPVPTGLDQTAFSYQMQRVGTDLQAAVVPSENAFQLTLTVTDRSHFINPKPEPGREKIGSIPTFRSLTTSSRAILANGETAQVISALDPASNETFRIDVTLTVGNK
jgi:hypothetical protein